MHVVESYGSGFGRRIQGRHSVHGFGIGTFVEPEVVSASTLRLVSVDVSPLVLGVEHEPQLDARVRHSEVDAVLLRESVCFGEAGVLVDVEHAPVAVVTGAASASFVVEAPVAFGDGVSHDRERCPMAIVDDHGDSFAVFAVEVGEVDHFGCLAFGEDEDPTLGGVGAVGRVGREGRLKRRLRTLAVRGFRARRRTRRR